MNNYCILKFITQYFVLLRSGKMGDTVGLDEALDELG